MPNLTTKLCPAIIHPASCLFSFSGSAKLRSFSPCQALSQPCPERGDEVTNFWAFAMPPLLSKTPFALKGAQRYETFRFVKPFSLSSTHFLTGWQRYGLFDIHKYHPTLPPAYHLSKIMPNLTTNSTPLSFTPSPASSLFQEAQRYETFRFVKPLSLSSTHFLTGLQRHKDSEVVKASYSLLPCSPTLKDPAYS